MQDEKADSKKGMDYRKLNETHLRDYARVILIRIWLVLLILILFIGASILYVRRLPFVYRSQALLVRESTIETLPNSPWAASYPDLLETWDEGQELILKSSSLLVEMKQRLLEKYDLQVDLEQIGESISLSPYKKSSTILQLTAIANTPEQAQALANTAAGTYIEDTARMKKAELSQGLGFLKQQMATLEQKTQEAEQALSDFRDREGLIFTTSETVASGLIEKLGAMQSELSQTESEIDLARSQLQSIDELISEKKKHARSSAVTELSPQMDQLQERLVSLELELNTKLETLTQKDPEVIAIQQKIDVVRRQLKGELDRLLQAPGATSLDPVSELQGLMQQSITLNVQLKGLERKAELMTGRIKEFQREHPELVSKQLELTRLERRARVYEQTYTTLMSKYEDMRLMEQMKTGGLSVLDPAPLPEYPVSPNKRRDIALGTLLGLFLGICAAFFLEYMDDSIKRKEDVDRFLGLPLMGAIPRIEPYNIPEEALNRPLKPDSVDNPASRTDRGNKRQQVHRRKTWQELLSHSLLYSPNGSHRSPGIESYRNLAANIRYANMDNPIRTLLVTSAMPREGKTITASNLAIVMAQSGTKTLLMDADLRRPGIHRIFQQDRVPGLTDLLMSDNGLPEIASPCVEGGASGPASQGFIRPTEVSNLHLLTCGVRVPNPGFLLPSERMREIMRVLGAQYDLIIVDSPPLGSVADAVTLGTEVDGTLMVIYSGETKREIALQAKESLEGVNAQVIGAVLNNVDYTKHHGYYYYNYRYYSYYRYYRSDDRDDSE